jgi:hypothetical protein
MRQFAEGAEELMAAGTTHADGTFSLKGQASDGVPAIDDIEPHLKIYYKCNEPLTQVGKIRRGNQNIDFKCRRAIAKP